MTKAEKARIAIQSAKGGAYGAVIAYLSGWATINITILFGLLTVGSSLSLPLLGFFSLVSAFVFGLLTFLSIKLRHYLIEKEFAEYMED